MSELHSFLIIAVSFDCYHQQIQSPGLYVKSQCTTYFRISSSAEHFVIKASPHPISHMSLCMPSSLGGNEQPLCLSVSVGCAKLFFWLLTPSRPPLRFLHGVENNSIIFHPFHVPSSTETTQPNGSLSASSIHPKTLRSD